ncbi:MAG: metal ABC transporter substrate-binding protein [Gemmatimonadota bacterium]
MLTYLALAAAVLGSGPAPRPTPIAAPLRVVATLPVYADLARKIGGAEVDAMTIANPNEDAHFVRPKPSFALELRRADLFITTGLDLELWAPTLLDRAGNNAVMEGGRGYVTAYTGVHLLDIPASADRGQGDVHIYGNPHLTTDPLRTLQIARNIAAGLKRVAPDRAAVFDAGLDRLTQQMHERLFGARLVQMLGGSTLEQMALKGTLVGFLENQEFEGRKLSTYLGGWLGTGRAFWGREIICYHKNWAYFEERFGVTCAEYVEAKPGIPPTPGHVSHLIDRMKNEGLNVLLAASYFDRNKVETVARRGGATAVIVPLAPGAGSAEDYFALVDAWVGGLARAFANN